MSLLARCMICIRIMSGYCPLSGYYPDIIRILSGYIMLCHAMYELPGSVIFHYPPPAGL